MPVTKSVYAIGGREPKRSEDLAIRCSRLQVGEPLLIEGIERHRLRRRRGVRWVESAIEATHVGPWDSEAEKRSDESAQPSQTGGFMAAQPLVVHCQHEPYDVYIGRGKDPYTDEWSEWSNKFSHRPSQARSVIVVGSVEEAVECHKRWIKDQIRSGRLTLERLAALDGKKLGCWCAKSDPCHGHTLIAAAAWAAAELAERRKEAGV
jgi:hypothetical protein